MSDNLTTGPKRDIELVKNVTTKDTNSDKAKSDNDTPTSDLKPGSVIFVMKMKTLSVKRLT